MHKKILLFIPIIILIISTAFTKNSTKKLDKQIFEIQEDIRALNDIYEMVLLDYNYLTSPNKLMEYSKIYLNVILVLVLKSPATPLILCVRENVTP